MEHHPEYLWKWLEGTKSEIENTIGILEYQNWCTEWTVAEDRLIHLRFKKINQKLK